MIVKTSVNLDRPLVPARRAATVTGALLILVIAGCGSSSKRASSSAGTPASTAPATPTKAEYLAKANEICNATNGPLTATVLKLASESSPVAAAHLIAGTFIPQIKSQLSQIQNIGTPAGGQATIATMGRLLAGDIARIEKDPAIAGPAAFHDFATVAHRYGLTACAPLS